MSIRNIHIRDIICSLKLSFRVVSEERRPVLVGAIRRRLIDIINEAAKEFQIDILALDIMPDHLHLCVSSPPTV